MYFSIANTLFHRANSLLKDFNSTYVAVFSFFIWNLSFYLCQTHIGYRCLGAMAVFFIFITQPTPCCETCELMTITSSLTCFARRKTYIPLCFLTKRKKYDLWFNNSMFKSNLNTKHWHEFTLQATYCQNTQFTALSKWILNVICSRWFLFFLSSFTLMLLSSKSI